MSQYLVECCLWVCPLTRTPSPPCSLHLSWPTTASPPQSSFPGKCQQMSSKWKLTTIYYFPPFNVSVLKNLWENNLLFRTTFSPKNSILAKCWNTYIDLRDYDSQAICLRIYLYSNVFFFCLTLCTVYWKSNTTLLVTHKFKNTIRTILLNPT